jgi:hypothetical protein
VSERELLECRPVLAGALPAAGARRVGGWAGGRVGMCAGGWVGRYVKPNSSCRLSGHVYLPAASVPANCDVQPARRVLLHLEVGRQVGR